ncbi:hypothetical protein GCM10010297_56910 [Streptomyces malachitofuscus]|nr:hypothetical protein GCM10010297_56910 [Streptomyces malachitofuscus]
MYVLVRLDVVGLASLMSAPSVLLVIGAAVASYLLGHLAHPLSGLLDKVAPRRNWNADDARQDFVTRVPAARDRAFVRADTSVLLAAVELHDKEAAGEITRLQGAGLMLRNSALALAFAFVVATAELVAGPHRGTAACSAALLLVSFTAAIGHGRRVRHWDRLKTLEMCFWIPDIDDMFDPGHRGARAGSRP